MADPTVEVLFNPRCSKCRQALELLSARGEEPVLRQYLEHPLERAELESWLAALGTDDPRAMLRSKESVYGELGLESADRERLLTAMQEHPILVERPVVRRGDRAVVARPPERLETLFE